MSDTRAPRVLRATLISIAVATLLLVTVVLPAEYGIDPLGTGRALGLLELSRSAPEALIDETQALRADRMRFELAPFESVEYKYRLEQDAALVFSWTATGEVVFDLHAEPEGAAPGYAESFAKGRSDRANGTYVAPFPGIHGWFWENRGADAVTVELVASGFFSAATEFRDGDASERAL